MALIYDQTKIAAVQNASDIIDVIGEHLALKKKGSEMVGLCPFHEDHRPSMYVNPTKQIFKCFACGAGGDVFRFVREYSTLKGGEPMTFYQAVRHVATEFGDPNLQLDFVSSSSKPSMSEEERKVLNEKKQRYVPCAFRITHL